MMSGKHIDGKLFGALFTQYVEAINKNSVNIMNAWDAIVEKQISDGLIESEAVITKRVVSLRKLLPMENRDLMMQLIAAKEEALEILMQSMQYSEKAGNSIKTGKEKLNQIFIREEGRIMDDNIKQSENLCNDKLSTIFNDIEGKLIEMTDASSASLFEDFFKKKLESYDVDTKGPAKAAVLARTLAYKMPTFLKKYSQNAKREDEKKYYEQHSKITELTESNEILKKTIATMKEENKMSMDKINMQNISMHNLTMEKEQLTKLTTNLKEEKDKLEIQLKSTSGPKKGKDKSKACDCRVI